MVTQLQLEIGETVHRFLKEHAKQDGVSVEGLIIRLIERYKRDTDRPGIAVRKVEDKWSLHHRPSPDGRYVSSSDRDGNLAVRDLTTGESRNITNDGNVWEAGPKRFCGPYSSTWSPDGVQIAYFWNNEGSNELRIIGLDGSKPRVLYRSEDPALGIVPSDWSQDGKFILGRRGQRGLGERAIVLISLADGSVQTLRSLEGGYGPGSASLSPDGRYVTYSLTMTEIGEEAFDVFLLATDGSEEEVRLVGHTDSHDWSPVWTPDGKSIVFVCDRDTAGSSSLWLTPVADGKQMGEPQLVIKCAGFIRPRGFTREGSLYYGISAEPLRDIWVASLNMETGEVESQPTRLRCEGHNGDPVWSPDGKSLAYASYRHLTKRPHLKGPILVIHSMETGKEREIHPETFMGLETRLRWSPDGRSILGGGVKRDGLHLLDIQTGHVTTIEDMGGLESLPWQTVNYPEWSRDGKTIFYIRRYTEKEWGFFSIGARDLATGEERELYTGGRGWSCLMVSPDGQELVFSDEDQKVLKVIPTAGGVPRVLFDMQIDPQIMKWVAPVTWTPDGRHLLFVKMGDSYESVGELWRIPSKGGEPEKLREIDEQFGIKELRTGSFHPDGERIAFARLHGESPHELWPHELWAMENLLTTFAADK